MLKWFGAWKNIVLFQLVVKHGDESHLLDVLDVHSKIRAESTYQPTSRCDRCRLAKNPQKHIGSCLPEVASSPKKKPLRSGNMMALQKQGTPPDPCLELEGGLCNFCLSFFAAWIWECRETENSQNSRSIHSGKPTWQWKRILWRSIFYWTWGYSIYILVSQRVSNILSENNEGPVHRNAYRCCDVARRGKSWICSKL